MLFVVRVEGTSFVGESRSNQGTVIAHCLLCELREPALSARVEVANGLSSPLFVVRVEGLDFVGESRTN